MDWCVRVEKNFFRIPVKTDGIECDIFIYRGDEKVFQFTTKLMQEDDMGECEFYAELPMREFKGETLKLVCIPLEEGKCPKCEIVQSNDLLEMVRENRPYIHFTPKSGHLNDPNGLCKYNDEYHLFFQHNIFDIKWADISWGHAVSKDLLHWEQVEEALMPDADGGMFSGSAIADSYRVGGLAEAKEADSEKEPLLLFYTHAGNRTKWSEGKRFDQRIAWSVDGRTFHKIEKPVIPYIVYENRDPKVYWHEETRQYFMMLFLDEHEYAIFVSKDLKNWEMTQQFHIDESEECPDMVELSTDDGEKKWVFWTPRGYYFVGSFDGRIFTREQEAKCIYGDYTDGVRAYAAQTFWGIEGRTVQLPWLTVQNTDNGYRGMMGLPRELKLKKVDNTYIMQSVLAKEVCEQEECIWSGSVSEEKDVKVNWSEDGAVLVHVDVKDNISFEINLCSTNIKWEADKKLLYINDKIAELSEALEDMTVVIDREMLELGLNQDTVSYFKEVPVTECKELHVKGDLEITLGIVK